MGYTYQEIANLTPPEIQTLQLGWAVKLEQEADAQRSAMNDHRSHTDQRKRSHKADIERRLRDLEVD